MQIPAINIMYYMMASIKYKIKKCTACCCSPFSPLQLKNMFDLSSLVNLFLYRHVSTLSHFKKCIYLHYLHESHKNRPLKF